MYGHAFQIRILKGVEDLSQQSHIAEMNPEIEKDAMRVGQYVISERERKEFDNIT